MTSTLPDLACPTPDCVAAPRRDRYGSACSHCGVTLVERLARGSPLIGRTLADRYDIIGHIGDGGMAHVYRGWQRSIGRQVAIKRLKISDRLRPDESIRFKREAWAIGQLASPHTVSVLELLDLLEQPGEAPIEGAGLYLVMELLNGRTLDVWASEVRPDPWLVVEIVCQILSALEEVHRQGIVHRDLKPGNVMILAGAMDAWHAKVLDFGLAGLMEAARGADALYTRPGLYMGTPAYTAPERIHRSGGARVPQPTEDVFAVGCILFELLTGQMAFPAQDATETFNAIGQGRYPPLPETVPEPIRAWVRTAMAHAAEERYADAQNMLSARPAPPLTRSPTGRDALAGSAPASRRAGHTAALPARPDEASLTRGLSLASAGMERVLALVWGIGLQPVYGLVLGDGSLDPLSGVWLTSAASAGIGAYFWHSAIRRIQSTDARDTSQASLPDTALLSAEVHDVGLENPAAPVGGERKTCAESGGPVARTGASEGAHGQSDAPRASPGASASPVEGGRDDDRGVREQPGLPSDSPGSRSPAESAPRERAKRHLTRPLSLPPGVSYGPRENGLGPVTHPHDRSYGVSVPPRAAPGHSDPPVSPAPGALSVGDPDGGDRPPSERGRPGSPEASAQRPEPEAQHALASEPPQDMATAPSAQPASDPIDARTAEPSAHEAISDASLHERFRLLLKAAGFEFGGFDRRKELFVLWARHRPANRRYYCLEYFIEGQMPLEKPPTIATMLFKDRLTPVQKLQPDRNEYVYVFLGMYEALGPGALECIARLETMRIRVVPISQAEMERILAGRHKVAEVERLEWSATANPFDLCGPVESVDHFFGNVGQLQRMIHRLYRTQHGLLLVGAPRAGTTSILKQIYEDLIGEGHRLQHIGGGRDAADEAASPAMRVAYIDLESWTRRRLGLVTIAQEVARALGRREPRDPEDDRRNGSDVALVDHILSTAAPGVPEPLGEDRATPRSPFVLILDGIHRLISDAADISDDQEQLLRWLYQLTRRPSSRGAVRLVLGSRDDTISDRRCLSSGRGEIENPFVRRLEVEYIDHLTRSESREFFQGLGARAGMAFQRPALDELYRQTGGLKALSRWVGTQLFRMRVFRVGDGWVDAQVRPDLDRWTVDFDQVKEAVDELSLTRDADIEDLFLHLPLGIRRVLQQVTSLDGRLKIEPSVKRADLDRARRYGLIERRRDLADWWLRSEILARWLVEKVEHAASIQPEPERAW